MKPKYLASICGLLLLGLLLSNAAPAVSVPGRIELYVSKDGRDNWSGNSIFLESHLLDGPLASLEGARNALRRIRENKLLTNVSVTIYIGPGTYYLDKPFVLEPQDSGSSNAPVTIQPYRLSRPIISGGRVLTGFRQNGPLWECAIPEVKAGQWYFRQLFVNGQRRQRARSPNEDYFRIAGLLPGAKDAKGKDVPARTGFIFKSGDMKSYERVSDVNLSLMHSWETSIHPLKSVDTTANKIEFVAPLKEWWGIGYWEKAQRYYLENAFEFLDQPGEWYLNRQTGVLSYYPMPGEKINEAEVIAPAMTELVRFVGKPDENQFVKNVFLKGLAFHYADWELAPQGNSSTQAAVEVPASVTADGALNCSVENCEVAHVGQYGIWFRRGCKDCRLVHNRLFDLGAGGIRIGEANMAKTDAAESNRNLVDNNHIYDGGHVYAAGIGIWVAQSSHNRISHNEIHDFLYSGMSIGWNWNDATNRTHHNLIEFNHVHHLVKGVLSDAGAIYCLGASPGSIIRNNLFHDVWPYSTPPFGWGIYLDATCSGYLVESNIAFNTQSGSLMYNNGGHEHVIQNNIFAFSAAHMLWPYFEKRTNIFRRNLIYLTQGDLFISLGEHSLQQRLAAKEPLGYWDDNLYWHTGGPENLKFLRRDFADWQALGLDRHSKIADPQFVNPAQYDFHLKSTSPALQLGFQQIDPSQVGLYGDATWVAEARQIKYPQTVLPSPPPQAKPTEIDDDFEATPIGSAPKGAQVSGQEKGASIRVTDEQALSGKHSLKVADAKELTPSWQPHFFYEPHLRDGLARQSFDLRMEPNALMFTEWRDNASYPQNVGPSVTLDGQGRISAGGKLLTTVPLNRWTHIEIQAAVGKNAPQKFTLTVVPPEGPAQTFADLPFAGKSFQELHWLGFSSTAAADTAFYLDNLKLKRTSKP